MVNLIVKGSPLTVGPQTIALLEVLKSNINPVYASAPSSEQSLDKPRIRGLSAATVHTDKGSPVIHISHMSQGKGSQRNPVSPNKAQ